MTSSGEGYWTELAARPQGLLDIQLASLFMRATRPVARFTTPGISPQLLCNNCAAQGVPKWPQLLPQMPRLTLDFRIVFPELLCTVGVSQTVQSACVKGFPNQK